MKEKKGFTLIELLAVIVILAIIALIAVPIVMNLITKARMRVAETSTLKYISAIEYETAYSNMYNTPYLNKEDYAFDEIEVSVKGTLPTAGIYSLADGKVTSGTFCVNGYEIEYDGTSASAIGQCNEEDLKLNGQVQLSEYNGNYTYPETKTFTVTTNKSGGELSCVSSDNDVATCSIEGMIVTVFPGTKEGSATITVKSAEIGNYKEAKAAYTVITAKGLLSVTANGYTGSYDGNSYGITVSVNDAEIKYGLTEGIYDLTENPLFTDAGTYIVYYEITKPGYATVTGSKQVIIDKTDGTLILAEESGKVGKGYSKTILVTDKTGDINCESSDEEVATCLVSGTQVIINGVKVGNASITITSLESINYNSTSAIYSIEVKEVKTLSSSMLQLGDYIIMTPTSKSYNIAATKTGYSIDQTINPSELNCWRVIEKDSSGYTSVVSEYVSSTDVYFTGKTGYINYVALLNEIASQYKNTKYTTSTRYTGYNGQTKTITDTSKIDEVHWQLWKTDTCEATETSSDCHKNQYETLGGGDILYQYDYDLIKTALGTLKANRVNTNTPTGYYLSSRVWAYGNAVSYFWGRAVNESGTLRFTVLWSSGSSNYGSGWITSKPVYALRPIVTLKSGIKAIGSGTKDDPYVLQ